MTLSLVGPWQIVVQESCVIAARKLKAVNIIIATNVLEILQMAYKHALSAHGGAYNSH